MIPTYVQHIPDGTESGTFLALDLGGTNLRVCQVVLDGKGKYTIKQEKYKVTDQLKTGEVVDLFDYIAESVEHFVKNIGDGNLKEGERLSLGFTFSFPVLQTALDKGTLITWTKVRSSFLVIDLVAKLLNSGIRMQERYRKGSVPPVTSHHHPLISMPM